MAWDWTALAHESRDAAGFEASALAYFQREVGCEAAFFSVEGWPASPTVLGLDPRTVREALTGGESYAQELLPVKLAALAARGVAVDTAVLGVARVRRARYFREVVASTGGRHSLLAYVRWRGRVIAKVMLGRTGGTFSSREVGLVESALPGLAVARAAFELPWPIQPLGETSPPTLLQRLGFEPRARVLAEEEREGETLIVRDRAGYREMVAADTNGELIWTRASLRDASQSGWPYVDLFHLAAALSAQRRRALFIGCGGGVALQQFARVYPGIALDVVERDPAVIALARRWFSLDAIPNTRVHIADGADFVARAAPGTWDVAVVDAYDASGLSGPFAERRFFADLRRALDPTGSAAFNVIGTLAGPSAVRDVARLARSEFNHVRLLPVVDLDEAYAAESARNVVIVASGSK